MKRTLSFFIWIFLFSTDVFAGGTPAPFITKEKAAELANQFLETRQKNWGKPLKVEEAKDCTISITPQERGNTPDEIWKPCYYVTYFTEPVPAALKGQLGVIVSRDGSAVFFSPRE